MILNIKNMNKAYGKLFIALYNNNPVEDPEMTYKAVMVTVNVREIVHVFYNVK